MTLRLPFLYLYMSDIIVNILEVRINVEITPNSGPVEELPIKVRLSKRPDLYTRSWYVQTKSVPEQHPGHLSTLRCPIRPVFVVEIEYWTAAS